MRWTWEVSPTMAGFLQRSPARAVVPHRARWGTPPAAPPAAAEPATETETEDDDDR